DAERTKNNSPDEPPTDACWRSFGFYRFAWPRRQLFARMARALCGTIVEHWMTKDGAPVREAVKQQIDGMLTYQQFTVETFHLFLQDACQKALGKDPEARFDEILLP